MLACNAHLIEVRCQNVGRVHALGANYTRATAIIVANF